MNIYGSDVVCVYVIHCLDDLTCGMIDNESGRFGGSKKRMSVYSDHIRYQTITSDSSSAKYIKKIGVGPMESDDGKYMIGSLIIVEATKKQVDEFIRNDPFVRNQVWKEITVRRWISPNGIKPMKSTMINNDRSTLKMHCNDSIVKIDSLSMCRESNEKSVTYDNRMRIAGSNRHYNTKIKSKL